MISFRHQPCSYIGLVVALAGALMLAITASTATAARFDPDVGNISRTCSQEWLKLPLKPQQPPQDLEIDIYGHPAPTCHGAVSVMLRALRSIPNNKWGRVGGWRCAYWAVSGGLSEVECKRGTVKMFLANPGD